MIQLNYSLLDIAVKLCIYILQKSGIVFKRQVQNIL